MDHCEGEAIVDLEEILLENARRTAKLDAPYDPTTGEGSPIERVDFLGMNVPSLMLTGLEERARAGRPSSKALGSLLEAKDIDEWCKETKIPKQSVHELRYVWDFELWAAEQGKVEYDEETRIKTGQDSGPFVLNAAQRILLFELMSDILSLKPMRKILLKARQFGGSTFSQLFTQWVQLFHRKQWHSCILAPSQSQAGHLRRMYERSLPEKFGELVPYQGLTTMRQIEDRGCIVGISSIEKPDALRGFTFHLLHMSEVGLWQSTPKKNAHDYIQAAFQTVPMQPWTMILMESTAKGVGNYFHKAWQAASKGESAFSTVFIPWYVIEKYRMKVTGYESFVSSMDDYDWFLWGEGASLEQINWYHAKLREFNGDKRRMQNEYPTTPDEAFQASGSPVFTISVVQERRRQYVEEPIGTFDLRGVEMDYQVVDDGPLKVWRKPEGKILRRYVGFADIGGKTETADWSVLTIIDRMGLKDGKPLETVARLRMHLRPDLFAWYCARVCNWYGDALLAFEINRHHKDRGDDDRGYEPEWSLAGIEAVANKYPNLYRRPTPGRLDEPQKLEIGFHTNMSTKPMIINALHKALDEGALIDRDERFYDECMVYEQKQDGRMGAVDGEHDDVVMSTSGAVWLALEIPLPEEPRKIVYPKRTGGYAQF